MSPTLVFQVSYHAWIVYTPSRLRARRLYPAEDFRAPAAAFSDTNPLEGLKISVKWLKENLQDVNRYLFVQRSYRESY